MAFFYGMIRKLFLKQLLSGTRLVISAGVMDLQTSHHHGSLTEPKRTIY